MRTIKIYLQIMCVTLIGVLGSCNDPFYGDETFEVLELKKASGQKVVLSQAEIDGILFMREEEKLAHDVYVQLYEKYGHNIFLNISESEDSHVAAMLRLINFYGLQDMDQASEEPGVFHNEDLQILYNNLMLGATDLVSALEAGVEIEETDITDINGYMAETEVKNLDLVYDHLVKGSERHLASFNKVLDKLENKTEK